MSADVPIDELLQECERGVIKGEERIHLPQGNECGPQGLECTEPGDREVGQPPRVPDVGIDQPKARYSDRGSGQEGEENMAILPFCQEQSEIKKWSYFQSARDSETGRSSVPSSAHEGP